MTLYSGFHYKVTDTEIAATGRVETWLSNSREEAIQSALYTHQLHNGRATASPLGVIDCPSCGKIVITTSVQDAQEVV